MFEPQSIMDLQENPVFGDPDAWLSGDAGGASSGAGGNMDRVLFKNLVEIVPLVQSLIDRKAGSSFTRRGSMTYTKTPSRESLSRKGRNAAQSMPRKKRTDQGKNGSSNSEDGDRLASFSSREAEAEKEREELVLLRGQLDELQRKLSDRDDLLESAEAARAEIQSQLEELKRECVQKDSLIKSIQLQLSDAKVKLADKQAALEKTQWEAMTSGKRAEKLEQELSNTRGEVSSLMLIFKGLNEGGATVYCEDYDLAPYCTDESSFIDELDTEEMHRMEEARLAYIAAVAAAKERQDEESLAIAAQARLHLQSFAFRN